MKKITIGELEVSLCENIQDINGLRWTEFKSQMVTQESGYSVPSLKELFVNMKNNFDKNSPSGMIIELYEFITGLKKTEAMEDADQLMFALMTVEPGEDTSITDKNFLTEKLSRYFKQGLTQGAIIDYVTNFILALRRN